MDPSETEGRVLRGVVVDDETLLPLAELCRACGATAVQIECWVAEGVLEAQGPSRGEWRFAGTALARSRLALRLERDLELNPPGVALALELMDEIAALRARLGRR